VTAERRRGRFVVFEGPEGAGKSTQIERLAARLRAHGIEPVRTREPGGTPMGDRVRAVLLDPDLRVDATAEFLLYAATRAQHVAEVIAPALAGGRTVLSDRFAAASVAYQGYGRGLDLAWVADVNDRAVGPWVPDRVLLLDLEPEVGLARAAARGRPDRLEAADLSFHRRARQGFLTQAAADPARWRRLDAAQDVDALADAVWTAVADLFGPAPATAAPDALGARP
jgi:dTMP kinase